MTTIQVRYVGLKDREIDCVAKTGKTWEFKGDVQTVPASAWEIMSKHPDMWELVEEPAKIVADAGLSDVKPKAEAKKPKAEAKAESAEA